MISNKKVGKQLLNLFSSGVTPYLRLNAPFNISCFCVSNRLLDTERLNGWSEEIGLEIGEEL
jgi:hypothetical protein